jgi:pimeloyl-ACP methyl ester carboxylesterase
MKSKATLAQINRHVKMSDVRAAAQLATVATRGVTDVVEAMHATIGRPFGMARSDVKDKTNGITGFVYKSVRGVTRIVATSLDAALAIVTPKTESLESSFERDAAISALNGVLGDYLVKSKNSLAIPMSLRFEGTSLDTTNVASFKSLKSARKLAIFVHGLCMNDRQWMRNGHDHGERLAKELDYTPLYVRYNTGQHVSINGAELVSLFDSILAKWPTKIDDIVFVAHSMGGLVSRSALAQLTRRSSTWRKYISKAIFLGTPHHGAPLERGGSWIDIVLGATPYTKPFARLGKIRSAGITDLRFGNVVESDWINDVSARVTTPLPDDIECFAIAATAGKSKRDLRDSLLGDGLVPVKSALGKHRLIKHRLAFPETNTWIAYERNHMDLLSDAGIYEQIAKWLKRDIE